MVSRSRKIILVIVLMAFAASSLYVYVWEAKQVPDESSALISSGVSSATSVGAREGRERPDAVTGVLAQDGALSGWRSEVDTLEKLAAKNPDEALTRVRQLSDKEERKAAAMAVCRVISTTEPSKAVEAAWNLNIGKFANDDAEYASLENLSRRWAEADLVRALEWVAALPVDEESRRDWLVKGIVSHVVHDEPALAARIVAETLPGESAVYIQAVEDVVKYWGPKDYPASVAWLSSLSSPLARERGIEKLAGISVAEQRRAAD